jgi:CubicO group peptidase (beta-lactamase class C family)
MNKAQLARIAPHFQRYVDDQRLPGFSVTPWARGDQLVHVARGGYADRESQRAVSDDTIWRIYSMTKPLTSVGVMMLYEEGLFDLNDDVSKWIEALAAPRVYVGGTPTAPKTVPATEPVRVHHLLSHMSGLTYGFNYIHPVDAIYRREGLRLRLRQGADLAQAVHDWCSSPLLFQPGSSWNVSVATDVLGRLIEIWSGQSLEEFFATRLLGPLGMTDTGWYCQPESVDRLAQLYTPVKGVATAIDALGAAATHDPRIKGAGGGLVSTAGDYQKFMSMLLRGRTDRNPPLPLAEDARADDREPSPRGRRSGDGRSRRFLRRRPNRNRLRAGLLRRRRPPA